MTACARTPCNPQRRFFYEYLSFQAHAVSTSTLPLFAIWIFLKANAWLRFSWHVFGHFVEAKILIYPFTLFDLCLWPVFVWRETLPKMTLMVLTAVSSYLT